MPYTFRPAAGYSSHFANKTIIPSLGFIFTANYALQPLPNYALQTRRRRGGRGLSYTAGLQLKNLISQGAAD